MKKSFLKLLQVFLKIGRYFLFAGIICLLIGLVGVFTSKQHIDGMMKISYDISTERISVFFPVIVLLIAICICCCFIYISIVAEKLVLNFRQDQYFIESNERYIKNIRLSLWIWTGLQLLTALIANSLQLENLSDLFDVSYRDYIWNTLFLLASYVGSSMIQKGIQLQQSNDEII